jgi:hypothetical protein
MLSPTSCIKWPPRSPDLKTLGLLWVFVKDGAYVILLPATLEEVKAQITEACTMVTILPQRARGYCIWSDKIRVNRTDMIGSYRVFSWFFRCVVFLNPLMLELNPSAQRCLTIYFTRDFASWTVHFVNICMKYQQMQQLFIQFISYVW